MVLSLRATKWQSWSLSQNSGLCSLSSLSYLLWLHSELHWTHTYTHVHMHTHTMAFWRSVLSSALECDLDMNRLRRWAQAFQVGEMSAQRLSICQLMFNCISSGNYSHNLLWFFLTNLHGYKKKIQTSWCSPFRVCRQVGSSMGVRLSWPLQWIFQSMVVILIKWQEHRKPSPWPCYMTLGTSSV